ncbi:hypothetical protein CDQ75_00840 [Campylobacter hyointestinalis subsp. hyointestinalis]|nr:hypothetical protein CDQ68_05380 [Campylobacter hyointestinalis subsp. hyointestinalis]PPB54163.1 hypothetical protein CDQ69_04715 [Campylobacter hyointestinalis subsp. hyointestinalis]PPB60964.1 hypothetical protein CDQ73_08725 [Campylobacter hyointestinalis subsp. hyointestinalis]PPB62804.1 hypothetical protein CDQ72_02430 [Campylobacter hyointestinalis subsp. hyointestinalis]PPB67264.1 hypothetical protein CDQ75_00840 [Campylobacter hyointestinalis subsp. hyointestinalis]
MFMLYYYELSTNELDAKFTQYFSDISQKTVLADIGVSLAIEDKWLSFTPALQQEFINDNEELIYHFGGNPFTIDPNDKKDTYFRLLFGLGYNENEKINLEFNISSKQKLTNTDQDHQNINAMINISYKY